MFNPNIVTTAPSALGSIRNIINKNSKKML